MKPNPKPHEKHLVHLPGQRRAAGIGDKAGAGTGFPLRTPTCVATRF